MYKYYIIILLLINIHFCKCLLLKQSLYIPIINAKKCNKKIIANLDDIIDYYHNKNIIGVMTHILPLFINYNKIEFVISYSKISSLLAIPKDNKFKNEIRTYIIINLGILAKKTNTEITIIYSKFLTPSIDYYMAQLCMQNNFEIDILKKKPISLFLQLAAPRINAMKFNDNTISYHSINVKPLQSNDYNIISIKDFFE
jgi:hypothetical protein